MMKTEYIQARPIPDWMKEIDQEILKFNGHMPVSRYHFPETLAGSGEDQVLAEERRAGWTGSIPTQRSSDIGYSCGLDKVLDLSVESCDD
jgi:hypothetical protein